MITVITSVPPTPPQREVDQNAYSGLYRMACVDSWNRLGPRVISVNSSKESELLKGVLPELEIFSVDSDGSEKVGKPLVLLDDLIRTAQSMETDIIAFVNADIYLANVEKIKDLLVNVTPGSAIVANRTDIVSLDKMQGSTHSGGYDLFVVHRDDLRKISTKDDLYFGDPWWDYHALCNLVLSGVSVTSLDSSHVLHLYHDFAFTWDRWTDIGKATLEDLNATVKSQKYDKSNSNSKALACLIKGLVKNVHRCDRPAHIHFARMMSGRKPCELEKNSLLKFANKLVIFAEHSLGFQPASQEQIALGCVELKMALSQAS